MQLARDRLRPRAWIPALALLLAGCGGHLHRKADALMSEAAMQEVEALEFDEGFSSREALEAELLSEELEAARHEVAAARDAALLAVIDDFADGGRATWRGDLDRRLEQLTGQGFDADLAALGERFGDAGDALASFESRIRELERQRDAYLARAVALGLEPRSAPMPRCPGADDPARSAALDDEWRAFAEACTALHDQLEVIGKGTGELQQLARALARTHEVLGARAQRAAALLEPYEQARTRCAELGSTVEVAACLVPTLEHSLLAAEAVAYVDDEHAVLQTHDLGSLGSGPGDPAHLHVVEEQLDAVERVLAFEAAAQVTTDAAREQGEPSEAAAVGLALAVTGTVARVSLDTNKQRHGVSRGELLLVRELLALERDGRRELTELGRHRLDLLLLELEAMLRERSSLLAAESFLLAPDCESLSITAAITTPADGDEAQRACASFLDASLIQYANAWTLGAGRRREAAVRADALFEREMRVRSGMTLAIRGVWIAAAVAELHRYNATGLEPATLATLLTNVAGFAVVAAGVFR